MKNRSVQSEASTLQKQESEVGKLAQALPAMENTIIPLEWLQGSAVHYQAHLEIIWFMGLGYGGNMLKMESIL